MATYRIEKRTEGQATAYWDSSGDTWDADVEMATVYSERERAHYANDVDFLPAGGVWVRLDGDNPSVPCPECGFVRYRPEHGRPAPPLTVHHLALVRRAVAQVITDGDPTTPRVDGKPVWSTDWQLYASGKAESFVEAVAQRVFELTTAMESE